MPNDFLAQPMRWATGFDGSSIPQLHIDQLRWSQHEQQWQADLERVRGDLGCRWVHYPLAWHEIEKAPGIFDWRACDERLEFAGALGLNLILGMAQCGTPRWLPHAFGDLEFPAAFERFAKALARHYGDAVRHVCPFNEPGLAARLSGQAAAWPPFGRGDKDFAAVSLRIADGTQRAIAMLRERLPGVEIWASEAVTPGANSGNGEDTQLDGRTQLGLDLLLGRVNEAHPLHGWLREQGVSRFDLDGLARRGGAIDVLNLSFRPGTEPASRAAVTNTARQAWQRYGIPLSITAGGLPTAGPEAMEDRLVWLHRLLEATRRLSQDGVPVASFACSPVVDYLDWDGPLPCNAGKIHHNGLFRLERGARGVLSRHATELSRTYAAMIWRDEQARSVFEPVPAPETVPTSHQNNGRGADAPAKKEYMNTTTPPFDGLDSTRPGFSLIVHSHLRWDWVWQRPQQFLSRLSAKHPVLFCEGPRLVEEDIAPYYTVHEDEKYPNVSILLTYLPAAKFNDGEWVDAQRLRLLKEALAGPLKGRYERPVQWFYDPMAVPAFVGKMGEIATVYDCMDQLSQFRFAPPALVERERMLLQRADVVFAGGYKMWEDKKRHNDNSHFYGCGVDVDHFATARAKETEIPADINFIQGPILGYFGVVDERLDYELIHRLAQSNPAWNVCIVGPPCKIDPNELPKADNLYWLGGRPYAELPAYAKAFDVCLMPFALNEATEFINPTKTLEYMAMGKPVVSTAVPDVVTNFGRNVAVAKDAEEFIRMCDKALTDPDCAQVKRGIEMANLNTWEYIVSQLERHIEEAIVAKAETARAVSHRNAAENKGIYRHGLLERRSAPRTASVAG